MHFGKILWLGKTTFVVTNSIFQFSWTLSPSVWLLLVPKWEEETPELGSFSGRRL